MGKIFRKSDFEKQKMILAARAKPRPAAKSDIWQMDVGGLMVAVISFMVPILGFIAGMAYILAAAAPSPKSESQRNLGGACIALAIAGTLAWATVAVLKSQ